MTTFDVVSVNISTEKGTIKKPVSRIALHADHGIRDDAHVGPWHRQVSLLGIEDIDTMRAKGHDVQPGDFAENITTRGIDLSALTIGARLKIGEAILEVTQIGKECRKGCAIMQQTGDCVMPRRGIFAKVVHGGAIDPSMKGNVEHATNAVFTMNARQYHESTSSAIFAEVYATIASQIVKKTGVVQGKAIDLGGGPGMLGIALAEITDLHVTVYDMLVDCITVARENIAVRGLAGRMCAQQGCAEALAFDDDSIDLVASRGSIFFWNDQVKGLSEVYRVLKPGGWAYIGGGFGSAELLQRVELERAHEPQWSERRKERLNKFPPSHYEQLLRELSIAGTVEKSEAGSWVIFQKPFQDASVLPSFEKAILEDIEIVPDNFRR